LGKQDQIWAKIFCIPKNMHSRTLMYMTNVPSFSGRFERMLTSTFILWGGKISWR